MLYLYIFLYLLLAHLLADFVFQPRALVEWKHKSCRGILVHSLIVFVTSALVCWPFMLNFWGMLILVANAVLHFAMDTYKISRERVCDQGKCYVRLFFLDQYFHILVLVGATFALSRIMFGAWPPVYSFGMWQLAVNYLPLPLVFYLIVTVLSSYVYEIVSFQFFRQKHGDMVMKFNYPAMLIRFLAVTSFFAGWLIFGGRVS